MSGNYHSNGGVVIIAASLEDAIDLYNRELEVTDQTIDHAGSDDATVYNITPRVLKLDTTENLEPRVYLFPDAGCC
jgi:hypothetical protein